MKDLIIIIGMTLFGTIIFNMMVGDNPDSLKNISKGIMVETIHIYNVKIRFFKKHHPKKYL